MSISAPESISPLRLILLLLLLIATAHINRIVSRVASALIGMFALDIVRPDTISSLFFEFSFVFLLDAGLAVEAVFIFVAAVPSCIKASINFLEPIYWRLTIVTTESGQIAACSTFIATLDAL